MKKMMKDVSDGRDVARYLVGNYLNSYSYDVEAFFRTVTEQPTEVRDNFTYLAFAWFHALSEVAYYDLRNEASVLMAQAVVSHVPELPAFHNLLYVGETAMDLERGNDVQAATMMVRYLMAGCADHYQSFLDEALAEHRTLQQSLTRLFRKWIESGRTQAPQAKRADVYLRGYALPMI